MENDIRRFAEHIYTANVEPLLEPEEKLEKDSFVNNFSKFLKQRIKSGLAQFKNGEIDAGINEGIADIEAGHCMELRQDNIKEVLSKPISEW